MSRAAQDVEPALDGPADPVRHHGQAIDEEWLTEVHERMGALRAVSVPEQLGDEEFAEGRSRPPALVLLRSVVGWSVILLGILGLVFPILQGIPLILAGVAILGPRSWPARRLHELRLAYRGWRHRRQLEWANRHL